MPSNQWAVITGASAGIGAAIFRRLVQREPNLNCLAVARRENLLKEVRRESISGSFDEDAAYRTKIISADVSTSEGISSIVSALPKNASVKYLIHNAGLLGPIGPLTDISRSTFHNVVATNLDAPLFLTQALLPHLKRCFEDGESKARILHVSSGAAHSSYIGWSPYCITKSALNMMYRCLKEELTPHNILVGSVRPGVVNTPMQDGIREYSGPLEHFPMKEKFDNLHSSGQLGDPDTVALYFHWLLSEIDDEEFVANEWEIRESKDDPRWNTYRLGGDN